MAQMDKTIELELRTTTDDETREWLAAGNGVIPPHAPGETGHYSDRNPEPIQVAEAWQLDANEFNMLKYLARWRKKGGIQSLEKIIFYAQREIALAKREGLDA
jgi:hypothetical protein